MPNSPKERSTSLSAFAIRSALFAEINILWIGAGPGCDGETVAMAGATPLFDSLRRHSVDSQSAAARDSCDAAAYARIVEQGAELKAPERK
jgi:hypothetical protein